jgi:lipoprotein-anchoring transpeptidase ErfK/SrfK
MLGLMGRLVVAGALSLAVAGCVPGGTPVTMSASAIPAEVPAPDTVYVARQDGPFTIPALPVEEIAPEFRRQTVAFTTDQPPGTIIINPATKQLHFVTGPNEAIRYGISVGRAGFEWSGEAVVTGRKPWPNWTPPPEMIARKPELAKWAAGQPGGPENPLGARALYLQTNGVDYGYRIHGTPEWRSIGSNASSGCIRMINQDVVDLYSRVPDGAKVIVMTRDGQMPTGLSLPPPAPKPASAKPKPAVAPVAPAVVPFGEPELPAVPVPPPVVI